MEPTILVKKSDGTFVRKPLSQVKASAKVVAPVPEAAPRVELASRPADKDFAEPLEGPQLKDGDGLPLISQSRLGEVQPVIRSLTFTVNQNLIKRLENAMVLYLKDVRTRDQTKNFLTKAIENGGVAITGLQAEEVLKACDKKIEQNAVAQNNLMVKPLKSLPTGMAKPLASATPGAKEAVRAAERGTEKKEKLPPSQNQNPTFTISGNNAGSRLMVDVVAPPLTINPVDEIRLMNLVDFRRLGKQPEQAAQILLNKFFNLKHESIIFYLQAREAWRQSPLYKTYVRILGQAVNSGQALNQVGGELTLLEIEALINLNSKLE